MKLHITISNNNIKEIINIITFVVYSLTNSVSLNLINISSINLNFILFLNFIN